MDYSPLWVSIKTAAVSTVATFFIGILFAWIMSSYNGKLKGIIDSILVLPMVLPPTVIGFFLLVIYGKNGPIGKMLNVIDVQIIFSWYANVIAAFVVSFPLMYKTSRGAFEQIDKNLIYAARTLGVGEIIIFWKVIVPYAWPGIAAGTTLAFARALGEFGATLMIAGNIPGETQTIPFAIFFAAEGGNMEKALVWVLLILVISLVIMTLMNYWDEYQKKVTLIKKKGVL